MNLWWNFQEFKKKMKTIISYSIVSLFVYDDDDDDEGRINLSVALSPKTTRTHNNKPKQ